MRVTERPRDRRRWARVSNRVLVQFRMGRILPKEGAMRYRYKVINDTGECDRRALATAT